VPDALHRRCDPESLGFRTTDELEPTEAVVGQPRAVEAVTFGIGINRHGYNLFCLGQAGTGKHGIVRDFLERAAADMPQPSDWCYVHNFDDAYKPLALRLPPGRALPLRDAMQQLLRDLRAGVPRAFESEEYQSRRSAIEQEFQERHQEAFAEIEKEAREKGVVILRGPAGFMFAPGKDGEPIKPEVFNRMPEAERQRYRKDIEGLQERLMDTMRRFPAWEKELREKLNELNREVARAVVTHLIGTVRGDFQDLPEVVAFLGRIEDDVVDNVYDFLRASAEQATSGGAQGVATLVRGTNELTGGDEPASFKRYEINVLVHNGEAEGAPVVIEDAPAITNLIGRIEHSARFGTLVTDFSLIKAGALHKANGGFLIVDARKLLTQPFSWDELKRALFNREVRIESLPQLLGYVTTVSLEPEPIPLDLKVVLVGEPLLYYLLAAHDPDFLSLFKVQAEFSDYMPWSDENVALYARLVATIVKREKLCPFDAGAVARVIEYASREAEDQQRLTAQISFVLDLLREADYWAGQDKCKTVTAKEVDKALAAQVRRADRIREAMYEQITREIMLIDTAGEATGQVNGLSVLQLGRFSFGKPSRITARVRLGRGEVVDIERRVELGGPLHSKGVMILTGFLGARFGQARPLALSASLVFEQSYGGVEGDSASSAELYALLSALSGVPVRQSLAVTGSVNQNGQVQAIGGVNDKIEGFFDICNARGLTGDQGVLIPASNVAHLMLRDDVTDAVKKGKFTIYPIATIDEGIELLTGVPAGEQGADGTWPEDSINGKVAARLDGFAQAARRFAARLDGEGGGEALAEEGGGGPDHAS
jgi:lon-related putative ATP-dependent protease